jgi:hypothetical protein
MHLKCENEREYEIWTKGKNDICELSKLWMNFLSAVLIITINLAYEIQECIHGIV